MGKKYCDEPRPSHPMYPIYWEYICQGDWREQSKFCNTFPNMLSEQSRELWETAESVDQLSLMNWMVDDQAQRGRKKRNQRDFFVNQSGDMTDQEFDDFWDSLILRQLEQLEEKLDKVSGQRRKNRRKRARKYRQHMIYVLLPLGFGFIGGCLLLLLEILLK